MKIIGHGGARGLAPENTITSFKKALENHVDEVEFDVRLSKDRQLVLIHDAELTTHDGKKVQIKDLLFEELARHYPDLIVLDDAIDCIAGRARVHIEVKPGVPTEEIIKRVQLRLDTGMKASDFIFASFEQRPLLDLKQRLPHIDSVVLEDWFTQKAMRRAQALGTKRICMMENWLYPSYIRMMAKRGYNIYCYPGRDGLLRKVSALFGLVGTCNTPERAQRWAEAGLAGVVTDRPDKFNK